LTLSYSSKGSPALAVKIVLSFPYNLLPVSCGNIDFLKKILDPVLASKSVLKVPLLPLALLPSANYSAE
jgi:hypothetical protein